MVDNTQLTYLINRDPILKFKYRGCFARDTFPILKHNEFVIVNTDPSSQAGEHWLLIASKNDTVLLYDSFGRDFSQFFGDIYKKVQAWSKLSHQKVFQYMPTSTLLQPFDSQFCGIFCLFIAYFYYKTKKSLTDKKTIQISSFPAYATEEDILRFGAAMLT